MSAATNNKKSLRKNRISLRSMRNLLSREAPHADDEKFAPDIPEDISRTVGEYPAVNLDDDPIGRMVMQL